MASWQDPQDPLLQELVHPRDRTWHFLLQSFRRLLSARISSLSPSEQWYCLQTLTVFLSLLSSIKQMQVSFASSSSSLTNIINWTGHRVGPQGSPRYCLRIEYNPLTTETHDPDSCFHQFHILPSQPITSQFEYTQSVTDNVKSLAKFKVDIIISLSSAVLGFYPSKNENIPFSHCIFSIPYSVQSSGSETRYPPQLVTMSLFDPQYNLNNLTLSLAMLKMCIAGWNPAQRNIKTAVFPWPTLILLLACYVVFIMELPIRQRNGRVRFFVIAIICSG